MNDAQIIGAGWNDHLASQIDATLYVADPPVPGDAVYDSVTGKRIGRTYSTAAVKALPPAISEEWNGTTRRQVMQTVIGMVSDQSLNAKVGDYLLVGSRWWRITRVQPNADDVATYCALLDVEAVAPPAGVLT